MVVLLCENKQFDKENPLTILSNVQLLHSPTQSFLPTKAQLCSLCILQAANPPCDVSPNLLPNYSPWEHPPAQIILLLSTVQVSASSVA